MKKLLLLIALPFLGMSQTQIGLDINGLAAADNTGSSVAVSANGTIIAVGSPLSDVNGSNSGCVRVYQKIAGAWVQQGATINGEAAGNESGYSVSLSADGSLVAIGAPENNFHTGHVRVYKNIAGVWTQQGNDIDGTAYGDASGWSTSLSADGTVVAIGSPYNTNNGNDSGIVRVYRLIGNTWSQIGANIDGWFYDAFGRSISLSADGTVVAVGSPYNSSNGGYSGRVRIYKNSGNVWTQEGADIRGTASNEIFGYSVAISADGNTVGVGAIGNSSLGVNSGYVKVFKNIAGTWTQQGAVINGEAINDTSGRSVSISADGSVVVIGANMNGGNGVGSGHVRIYKNIAGVWTQRGIDINGQAAGDNSGNSVALSGDGNTLIIGSPYNGTNGATSGQARVYDITQLLSSNSYVWDNFSVYPNPTSELLNIQLQQEMILQSANIYNALGQLVTQVTTTTIDVSSLAKGTYFVEVITNQGKATKSVIVE
ncbi:MAG: T9SS type A sorting domain-containing protein [Bacteroidota bacterium]